MVETGILQMIWNNLHKYNKNFIAICTGQTGSGKSWAMLSLAEKLDPTFNSARVVFNKKEFDNLINSGTLKSGNFILWDEAGAGLASRDAMTKENKFSTKVMQTIRSRNYGILYTVPDDSMIDKQIKQLAHYKFTPTTIDRKTSTVLLKIRKVSLGNYGKIFYTCPDINTNGKTCTVDNIILPRPSKKLIQEYETMKQNFQNDLYKNKTRKEKKQDEEYKKIERVKEAIRNNLNIYTRTLAGRIRVLPETIKLLHSSDNLKHEQVKGIKQVMEVELNETKVEAGG